LGPKSNEKNYDPWEQAAARYRRRKLNELVEGWQQERKAKDLPWRKSDLADEMHYHRNTLIKYLNGDLEMDLPRMCEFFHVKPDYFIPKLDELDLVDEQHHKMMQADAAAEAEKYHVSKGFLWFLKSDPDLQHEILFNQRTDGFLNSFDPEVPDAGSPFQFELKTGERAYLNESSMKVLGETEKEVRSFTRYQIWKLFNDEEKRT